MNNIIGLKPSQPFTLCEPITVDLRIAATVLLNFYEGARLPLYARSMKTIQSVLFKNPFYVVGITVILLFVFRLRVVPLFSSGIVGRAKRERA